MKCKCGSENFFIEKMETTWDYIVKSVENGLN